MFIKTISKISVGEDRAVVVDQAAAHVALFVAAGYEAARVGGELAAQVGGVGQPEHRIVEGIGVARRDDRAVFPLADNLARAIDVGDNRG